MLRFAIEVLIVLAISAGVLFYTPISGINYMIIGVVIALVGLVLIYTTRGVTNNDEHAPTLLWLFVTALLCGMLGAIWPSVPVVLAWQRAKKPTADATPAGKVDKAP